MSSGQTDAPSASRPPAGPDAQAQQPPDAHVAGRDVVVILGVFLALGAVAAVLWWLVVDPAEFTKAANGGLAMGEDELGKRFNDDGWFAVIAAVLGLLSGATVTWWRSRDPLLTAVLVLLGAALATAAMVLLGGLLGPPDPASVADAAAVGDQVPVPLEISGAVCYLVWPITALIGALLVLWSPPDPGRAPRATKATRNEDSEDPETARR